jgi:hypothetical protein
MGVLKKVLIGFGVVFLVIIALAVWLGFQSVRFGRAERPFVEAYVTDFSRHWRVADVYDRSANEFLTQASSSEGERAIAMFRPLGALTSISDFEIKNYKVGTGGRSGVFDFKGKFENGTAVVEVTIIDNGHDGARVVGVHMENITVNPGTGGKLST